MKKKEGRERVYVGFPDAVMTVIDNELIGVMGNDRADVVRTVVMTHLSEKGYIGTKVQGAPARKKEET